MVPIRIAVSANFTAEPLQEPLAHLLRLLRLDDAQIDFAPFDQVFQTLLDPTSLFATNEHGVNIVLLDTTVWSEDDTLELATALSHAHFRVPMIVASGPGTRRLIDSPDIAWIEGDSIAAEHPALEIFDPHSDREARIPYTRPYFAALALRLARSIRAQLPGLPTTKVIAVDCDNTLWRGVCGEDGPEGVTLDLGRRRLQEFLVAQRAQGKLICLTSKNNEEDVWETFRAHPEFPLRPEHCVSWRINWEPKSQNLASLAEELSLGADSFVLMDDDRRECGEVSSDLPDVLVLQLPQNPDAIGVWLDNLWVFDPSGKATEEDLKRNQYYSEISARSRLERQTASFEEFIARLELAIEIEPLTAPSFARSAQLTQRTNQMNLSTVRRTEAELAQLIASGTLEGRVVHVKDRFGDYGLVGLLLFRNTADELVIDTLLLSCRAMGRGVEHAMLRHAASIAEARKLASLMIRYSPTRKNAPAQALLDSLTGAEPTENGYRIASLQLAQFDFNPGRHTRITAIRTVENHPGPTALAHGDYAAIADLKGDPHALLAALSRSPPMSPMAEGTATEQALTRIWAHMLPVSRLALDDDFFDLGGHSLLAVQLLTRIRETFAVELSLDLVYSDKLTIRRLAAIIDNGGAIPEAGPDNISDEEYAALLAEVENLSDQEVQALLGDTQ